MKKDFDFSNEIARIQATTLIVAGDADIFPPRTRSRCSGCSAAVGETVGGMGRGARNRGSPSCRG
jgi:hypothetical protein